MCVCGRVVEERGHPEIPAFKIFTSSILELEVCLCVCV